MFKSLKNLFFRTFVSLAESISLIGLFRNVVGMDILKLSMTKFLSKFIHTIVMFLPLKVFIVLSNPSSVEHLNNLYKQLGEVGYAILFLSVTALLYLINLGIQLYFNRLLNRQKDRVIQDSYIYNGRLFQGKFLTSSYNVFISLISDVILLLVSMALFLILSLEYFFIFILLIVIYLVVIKYFVYTNNRFSFLEKLNIEKSQAVHISSGIFYLTLFVAVFYVFINFNVLVFSAILILLISRLCNNSIKCLVIFSEKIIDNMEKMSIDVVES